MAVPEDAIEVDATKKPLVICGTAFDINRVQQACQQAMRNIEFNRLDTSAVHRVIVPGPDPT